MGTFVISTRKNGEYQFNLKAGNGQVILASEGYSSKAACENGIESVRKNSIDDSRYERKESMNGKYYFNLKAGNGQVIGSSEMYETVSSLEYGIDSVKINAPKSFIEDTAGDTYLINNQVGLQESFRITRLSIDRIGPFENFEISFNEKKDKDKAEIHILTGENGTGKSTILQLLSHCVPYADPVLEKKFRKYASQIPKFSIDFSDGYSGIYHRENLRGYTINTQRHRAVSNKSTRGRIHPRIGKFIKSSDIEARDIAFFAYSGYRKLSDSSIESILNLTTSPFENALDFDKSTDTKTFVNWLASIITKKALATLKRSNSEQNRAHDYERTINYIQNTISEITGQLIEFELQEDPLKIIIHVDEVPLEFDQLPDGLKSIISWIGDLIMRLDRIKWINNVPITERNFLLFLDEIEIHLHPAWQRKVLPIIQKLFINAQIFVSTHSPFVVGSVDSAWVYRLAKKGNVTSELVGQPLLSEDSYSYEYILNEIFGVRERFGVDVEKLLNEFTRLKQQFLNREEEFDWDRFYEIVKSLQGQSMEVQNIIGMELRQLNRLSNNAFADL